MSEFPPPGSTPSPSVPAPHPHGGYPAQVAPKNPGIALVASFFFPGLGSLMNGEAGKGIGIFVGYVFSWMLTIILIGFIGVFGFWVWGMVDGYQGARKWNAAHGIIS